MRTICITGGIGSGKSVVSSVFKALGIPVYDADQAARQLYESNSELKAKVKEVFGEQILDKQGKIDRKTLAGLVFSDPEKLKQLNALVHPLVIKDFQEWKLQFSDTPYVLREAAILFESGTDKDCSKIIAVSAPEEMRIQRIRERDRRSRAEVEAILARQWKEEEKIRRSDFVIVNNEEQAVLPQVLAIHEQLMAAVDAGN